MHVQGPLENLEQWDDFVGERYNPEKKTEEFRDYSHTTPGVVEFYRQNHAQQTRAFVLDKKRQYTDLSQIDHNLQAAEAIRRDGHPDWFQLTGLLHDIGKVLCLYGEEQWAVVGDTFPTGCAYSDKIVFHEFFDANPDSKNPDYQTQLGVYEKGCGLDKVDLSWGHDEYFYHIAKPYLPEPALYMIRYHSFYPAHREGAYDYLMNDHDRKMFDWVRTFNPYDLYSKSDSKPSVKELKPYYQGLIEKYFPSQVDF